MTSSDGVVSDPFGSFRARSRRGAGAGTSVAGPVVPPGRCRAAPVVEPIGPREPRRAHATLVTDQGLPRSMASMDPVTTAVWLLLIPRPPAAGAVILAILARTGRASDAHPATTPVSLVTLTVTIAALVVTLVGGQVLGMPGRNVIGLGPLDPAEPLAGIAWSAAPSLLALLFLAIAVRARSRFLIALALVQAAVALLATAVETLAPEAHATTPNALVLDPLAGLLLAVSSVVGGLIVLFAVGYEPAHLAHRRIALARTPTFLAWLLVFLSAMHLLVLADAP